MKLQLLEKMPENFRFFQGKEIRTLVDLDTEELWFVAKDVANILGYIRKDGRIDTNNMLKRIDAEDKVTERIRHISKTQSIALINESGVYNSIFGSKKDESKEFKKWLTKDVLPSIRKNGFYISEKIPDSQVLDLVEKSLSIYENRKLFDLELRKLKSVIYGELLNQGATKKQIGGMFSNMFQNLHIATTKRTAGQIVFDEMKAQKRDLKIQTFNQLRQYPKEIKGDLLVALNYYSDDELIRFRGYLNSVITDVVQFIQSPHTTVTLAKLQFEISDSSQRKALKMTGYDIQRFPRPLRKSVAKILDLLLVDGTDSEILETMENIRITYHNLKYNQ